MLLFYILLVAFGCQQTPFLESENLKNSESEKGCEPRAMSNEPFSETEKSVNISEICGNEKTNHRLVQKKSEKGSEPQAMSNEQRFHNAQSSQLEAQSLKKTVDCCPLTVDYFENQIRLADSLYKNYLPQYNFEEVKAAVMFFDSLRLSTDNSQRTTDFLETENLKTSESEKSCEPRAMSNETFFESEKSVNISEICGNEKTNHRLVQKKSEKGCEPRAMSNEQRFQNTQSSQLEAQSTSQVFSFSDSQIQNNVDHHELLKFQNSKILEFLRARAHYYHAVGLTERDDIVGACEHYFIALEIMESETENLKTSKSGKGSEQRAMSHEQKFRNAHSSKLEAQSPDYEKIRFIALIYTRLGELFHYENCTSIAKDAYKKCINLFASIDDTFASANYYKQLGEIFAMENNHDSSLYFYKKSIELLHDENNQVTRESWKGISAILHHNGNVDSSYIIIRDLISCTSGDEQYAYKTQLAQMYYKDNLYDSALIYFKEVLNRNNKYTKISASNYISKIYSSKGDIEKSNYYMNLYSDQLIDEFNNTSNKLLMVESYNEYMNKRFIPSEIANSNKYQLISLSLCILVLVTLLCYIIKINTNKDDKKNSKTYKECVDEFKNENIYSKIILVKNEYIKSNETNKYKEFQFSNEDKEILICSINKCFNDFATKLIRLYPNLNVGDVMYCCLILLDLEKKEIGALMGIQYQSVKDRLRKLNTIFATEELNLFIVDKCNEILSL